MVLAGYIIFHEIYCVYTITAEYEISPVDSGSIFKLY